MFSRRVLTLTSLRFTRQSVATSLGVGRVSTFSVNIGRNSSTVAQHRNGLHRIAANNIHTTASAKADTGSTGGGASSHASDKARAASEEAFREKVLEAALARVADHGWTDNALRAGAESLGYPSTLHGLFPRGAFDLVDFWMAQSTDKSIQQLQSMPLSQWSTIEQLKAAIRTRLEIGVIPVVSNWSQAMAVGAQPQNLPHTLSRIGDFIDRVWFIAGDTSTDINWYVKRSLLLGVYTTTELYCLTDRSNGYADTWQFLQRRLEDSQYLASLPLQVQSVAGNVLNFVWNNINPPLKSSPQSQPQSPPPSSDPAAPPTKS